MQKRNTDLKRKNWIENCKSKLKIVTTGLKIMKTGFKIVKLDIKRKTGLKFVKTGYKKEKLDYILALFNHHAMDNQLLNEYTLYNSNQFFSPCCSTSGIDHLSTYIHTYIVTKHSFIFSLRMNWELLILVKVTSMQWGTLVKT